MAFSYTTNTLVQQHIDPDFVGSGTGQVSTSDIDALIPEGSEWVQSFLPNYWPFGDTSSTPATPTTIQRAAAIVVAALCHAQLHMANHLADDSAEKKLWADAREMLLPFTEGGQVLAREEISGEAITWGDNDPIPSDRSKLTKSANMDVDPPGATLITGYRYGVDFWVEYDSRFGAWFLIKGNSAITAGSDTVTYQCTYTRTRREVATSRVMNTRLVSV